MMNNKMLNTKKSLRISIACLINTKLSFFFSQSIVRIYWAYAYHLCRACVFFFHFFVSGMVQFNMLEVISLDVFFKFLFWGI